MRYPRFNISNPAKSTFLWTSSLRLSAISWLLPRSDFRLFFGSIVGIEPDDIARSRVALNREEFEIVVHIEYGFCGVDNSPYPTMLIIAGLPKASLTFCFSLLRVMALSDIF